MASLSGKRIAVIGGSSGIGFAVAARAAAEGAHVIVGSSNAKNVDGAIRRLDGNASGYAVDVRDEASVASFFERVGAFDHLVYTAGDWSPNRGGGPVRQLDLAGVEGKSRKSPFVNRRGSRPSIMTHAAPARTTAKPGAP